MAEEGVMPESLARVRATIASSLLAMLIGGCALEMGGFVNEKSAVARVATSEAVVGEDGRCTADLSIDPATFRGREGEGLLGVTECELVALMGPPLSVQTGASSQSRRETTMLYMEPSGKSIFLFSENRLVRVVR